MLCTHCNTNNPPNARGCFNCGRPITQPTLLSTWKNDAYIFMGIMLAFFVVRLPYLAMAIYQKSTSYNHVSKFYDLMSYINLGATFIIFTIAAILAKNSTVRIFLIVMGVIDLALDILNKVLYS